MLRDMINNIILNEVMGYDNKRDWYNCEDIVNIRRVYKV